MVCILTYRGGLMDKDKEEIFNIFFRVKPAMMLVGIYNATDDIYASLLAKRIDCTYSHVVKILQEMEKADLISFKKQGRIKLLRLTKSGEKVAEYISNIQREL